MTAMIISVLLGRLIFSYFLVWFLVFLWSKFAFKLTFSRVHSLFGMTAVSLIFLLPFLADMGERV